MRPSFSAASTIAQPIRSLREPPGFRNSHFAHRLQGRCAPTRWSRTRGVGPMTSRIESKRMPPLSWDGGVIGKSAPLAGQGVDAVGEDVGVGPPVEPDIEVAEREQDPAGGGVSRLAE